MYETSPWEDTARIAAISGLADKGDMRKLADALMLRAQDWHEGIGVNTRLRELPQKQRFVLAQLFVRHASEHGRGPDWRERALVLLATVADGFALDSWCETWTGMLEHWARRKYWTGISDEVATVAGGLLAAGRTLSGEVVGLLRRSALQGLWSAELLMDRIPEPLLNPGELWTDRILAELPELGEPWRNLVRHLLTAKSGRPTRRWDGEASAFVEDIGSEVIRRTVTPWLALATHGGSDHDGAYDQYNVHAVRGLAWLLSLLPPDPETVRVLGALVERPPVKSGVAGAGVFALARLDGEAGRVELNRLAGRLDHKVTLRQIHRALAARAGEAATSTQALAGASPVSVW
jgi:hypothetical protein